MDQILEGILQVQCILDDMIISGSADQEHLANLEDVLRRLSKHGLRANNSKCEFSKKELSSVVMRSASLVYISPNRRWMLCYRCHTLRMFPKFVPLLV